MSYEIWAVIIGITLGIIIISFSIFLNLYGTKNRDILIVKEQIRKHEDISKYDVEGRPHEAKIRELLEKNGYVYMDITAKSTGETIYGVGVAEFKDGTKEYHLYTSKRHSFNIDKDKYEDLKNHIGETIDVHYSNYKWVKEKK